MKIADGFILRKVAGDYVVVAVGGAVKKFNGVISLNETGAFMWKLLSDGITEEDLVKAVLNEYSVDEKTAETGVKAFVAKLKEADLVK